MRLDLCRTAVIRSTRARVSYGGLNGPGVALQNAAVLSHVDSAQDGASFYMYCIDGDSSSGSKEPWILQGCALYQWTEALKPQM